jgi:hypothetical protein
MIRFVIRSREEVEKCLNVYLKFPGVPKELAKTLLTRGSARLNGTRAVQPGSQLGCKGVSSSPAFYAKYMFNLYR